MVYSRMNRTTRVDAAGRLVIPKTFRDHYGFDEGTPIEVIAVPDGIMLVPARGERKIVKRGRILAIDTGAGIAPAAIFDPGRVRLGQLDRKGGFANGAAGDEADGQAP